MKKKSVLFRTEKLSARVANEGKEILRELELEINRGEIHVIMGPNGAGKSTLANVILGNPSYTKTSGEIYLDGEEISGLKTDERGRKGIFMSFQTPQEIDGVSVANFLKTAKIASTGKPVRLFEFKKQTEKVMDELNLNRAYASRNLNVGFSGGEKKKAEILQMLMLEPKLAVLDETDSGLDVDAIRTVSKGISMFSNENNGVLIITHGTKLLESLDVDFVHVLVDGKIVETGGAELAKEIEKSGFEKYKADSGCGV